MRCERIAQRTTEKDAVLSISDPAFSLRRFHDAIEESGATAEPARPQYLMGPPLLGEAVLLLQYEPESSYGRGHWPGVRWLCVLPLLSVRDLNHPGPPKTETEVYTHGFPVWAQLRNLQQRGIGVQTCRKVTPDPTGKCTTRKPKAVRKQRNQFRSINSASFSQNRFAQMFGISRGGPSRGYCART